MKCQTVTYKEERYFIPYCWGGVIHGKDYCTCYPVKVHKSKKVKLTRMDIINRLHSTFRDCKYFEFGEDYVRFFDEGQGKYFEITVREYQQKEKRQLCAQTVVPQSMQSQKTVKVTPKTKKTWESILKEKNK